LATWKRIIFSNFLEVNKLNLKWEANRMIVPSGSGERSMAIAQAQD
jgi:hypothetical protein